MGKKNAIEYWKSNKDFELILVTENKEIYITTNLKNSFNVTDKSLTIININ